MHATKHWTVEVLIGEDEADRVTHAEARLKTPGREMLQGKGNARRNPQDPNVPEIGDELAVARALSDLAHELLHAAVEDIQQVTREKVTLSS
jgi:hypothetical protein